MKIYHIPAAPPLYTNTFLLVGENGLAAAVDPAAGAQEYLRLLEQEGARLTHILLTHGHYTLDVCEKLAQKCAGLRIFEDAGGKLNVSAEELGCEALVVSNFTLYGDTKKGKRPSFIAAAKPPLSVEAYEAFVAELRKTGLARVETGEFGADMKVTLTNDGPVTIVIDTDEWKR